MIGIHLLQRLAPSGEMAYLVHSFGYHHIYIRCTKITKYALQALNLLISTYFEIGDYSTHTRPPPHIMDVLIVGHMAVAFLAVQI